MSGRIQRVLVKIFDRERDNAFTTEDLCERIWPDLYPDSGHRVRKTDRGTVIRAVRHIASQRPEIQWLYSQRLGGLLVFFRHDEVMSYAMARLKADRFQRVSQPTIRTGAATREPCAANSTTKVTVSSSVRAARGGGRSKSFSPDEGRHDPHLVALLQRIFYDEASTFPRNRPSIGRRRRSPRLSLPVRRNDRSCAHSFRTG